jgi:hypothetical protein
VDRLTHDLGRPLGERPVGPCLVRGVRLTPSMRTTGACDDSAISAANPCSPRSCMRAVVRPRCCTSCCTTLTCKPQASLARLAPDSYSSLPLASSSGSQVPGQAARAVARLTSGVLSTVICQRPWLVVVKVTHLVTWHQSDQPVADPCHGHGCSWSRRRSALAATGHSRVRPPCRHSVGQ